MVVKENVNETRGKWLYIRLDGVTIILLYSVKIFGLV